MKREFKQWLIKKLGDKVLYLRVPTVARFLSDKRLNKIYKKLKPEKVLFVGASWKSYYKKKIPNKEFITLDIDKNFEPNIVSDVHNIKAKSNTFDVVVMTRVLEHCYNPQKAINEVYRVLKPGGVAIYSAPFIYKYHASPHDYFRFTHEGFQVLCKKYSKVKIIPYGNRLHVIWMFLSQGLILRFLLTPFNFFISLLDFKSKEYPLGYVVSARK